MTKFKLYTYDLWADQSNCNDCTSPNVSEAGKCLECKSTDIHTSYSVNDVFGGETIEAETLDQAITDFGLKLDIVEEDNNYDNSMGTVYFRYKSGKYNGSPACEIREVLK